MDSLGRRQRRRGKIDYKVERKDTDMGHDSQEAEKERLDMDSRKREKNTCAGEIVIQRGEEEVIDQIR